MLQPREPIVIDMGVDFIICGVLLEGGNRYEHIASVRYKFVTSTKPYEGELTVASVIEFIEQNRYEFFSDGKPLAKVYVSHNAQRKFIESRSDSTPSNNLLAQPRF